MGFLESAGMLSIIAILVMVTLYHLSSRDHNIAKPREVDIKEDSINEKILNIKERIREKHGDFSVDIEIIELSRFSPKCENYLMKRNRPIYDGANGFYDSTSRREITAILRDPLEYWTAMEKYYWNIEGIKKRKKFEREKIELYIKYNEVVFSIFDTNRYLTKEEIISNIISVLKVENSDAEKLMNLWEEYLLVFQPNNYEDYYDKEMKELYSIFPILECGDYESDFKVTRKDWLLRKKSN
jgi:hypothetical protein